MAASARERVLEMLSRHGGDPTSFTILGPQMDHWFEGDACVAFVDTGRARVAAGAPVASAARVAAVACRFVADAARDKRRACFFGVDDRFARAAALPALHIGDQAVWDPSRWEAAVRASRGLRKQLRYARAKGVAVRALAPEDVADPGAPARRALERLVARWLAARPLAPMGFVLELTPFSFPHQKRYFVAEAAGRVVGLLSTAPVYARAGWFIEHALRDPAAPSGTLDLLVHEAILRMASEGCRYATFGLAPLAGTRHPWLRLVRRLARPLYDFEGLRAFKARLRPAVWEPAYLCYPAGASSMAALYDALSAFAHGSLWRFGARSLIRLLTPASPRSRR